MSMDEASLIRAKASAMADAAQERLRVEEELFKSRLKAATDDVWAVALVLYVISVTTSTKYIITN